MWMWPADDDHIRGATGARFQLPMPRLPVLARVNVAPHSRRHVYPRSKIFFPHM
jgi:hypothetical protein